MNKMKKPFQWLVLAFAILLPFLIIRIIPDIHHHVDLRIFREWADAWEMGWRSIYVNCQTCNYPFLGTYFSGGWMSTIDFKSAAHVINRFRYYLALVDGLNVLALWFILTRLQIKNAPLWAGLIGLLPSSWIGASVWGQIDGVGQFPILLFFILLFLFNSKLRSTGTYYLFLAAAGFLLALMLLTKQLIYFSVFGLGVILLANIILYSRSLRNFALSVMIVAFFVIAPILLIDFALQVPDPYLSHLHYILATGSQHGDIISSLGLNIWSLFSTNILGSSHVPLQIGSFTINSVSPYGAGIFLFVVINAAIFYLFVRDLQHQHGAGSRGFNTQQMLSVLMYFAMVNATFNLTLTGTHERYLFHFFPFILIVCLGWKDRASLVVTLTGALLYGAYLYGYLDGMIHRESQSVVQAASFIYLLLFVYLIIFWVRNFNSRTFDVAQA